LSPNDDRLLAFLENPTTAALVALTGWEQDSLGVLATHIGATNLADLDQLQRLFDMFALVTACGISAAALIAATTNDPAPATVSALQSALRARYAEIDWLAVVKPINDTMRDRQRDALVASVLQQLGDQPATQTINTPDKLFEYLLMDVEMEPCMQTSRIRHALSSVQLFIERCLQNLEATIDPSALSASDWSWMKRYRIWQANREVFLWPENWLDPEYRDDQTPFFTATMTTLLQSDITDDSAATGYLDYLSTLEDVAKLEPCGMYYIESDPSGGPVTHAIARTTGARRKYYYRRLESDGWTAWDEIKLAIEDDPVMPVVWNGRVLLFWLRILQQTPPNTSTNSNVDLDGQLTGSTLRDLNAFLGDASSQPVTMQAVLCWSEYYNGKWQPIKTSDHNLPTTLGQFPSAGPYVFNRSRVVLGAYPTSDGQALYLFIGGYSTCYFLFYNTHSRPVRGEDVGALPAGTVYPPPYIRWMFVTGGTGIPSTLTVIDDYENGAIDQTFINEPVVNPIAARVVVPWQAMSDAWVAPFFYEDSRHVFYVTASDRQIWLPVYNNFGLTNVASMTARAIAPLVIAPRSVMVPMRADPATPAPTPGGGVARFVSEDAFISRALGDTTPVAYGTTQIGVAGEL
jgi:hypothetical protein